MRLSLKAKQVAGVTALVGLAIILLSAWDLATLADVHLKETRARGELVARTIFQRVYDIIASGGDPRTQLAADGGLQSILTGSVFDRTVVYAAIVDDHGVIIAHNDPTVVASQLPPADSLNVLLDQGPIEKTRAIYAPGGRTYEVTQALVLAAAESTQPTRALGSVRVGVSTLLIRQELERSLKAPLLTALGVLLGASLVSMLLAQLVLRPIHVIRSGLARLGRGELNVSVDLSGEGELADLGDSFKAVTARLAADRTQLAGQQATLESVVEHLEDAVAFFSPDGTLLFANPPMRALLPSDAQGPLSKLLPAEHPYRLLVEETLTAHEARGPKQVWVPGAGDRLIMSHLVEGGDQWLGVVLVARNLAYLSEVESTLSYSRKLAALGRLSAGIAHEVKNPLNATMIHLELLKMQLTDLPAANEHVQVIAAQVRRLDEVVQGFLRFTRPEDLKLQPVEIGPLLSDLLPIIHAEAQKSTIDVQIDCPASLPAVSADPALLQQALLNLALNACQAMPHGGKLSIAAAARPNRRLEISFEDTGVGIAPEHLERIFELYFTTKETGSGIGLAMVYRAIQLHDGEIEVQSVVGKGTTFRVTLRQA